MMKKRIVIAGGGFGGIATALHLDRSIPASLRQDWEVTLVNNHHSHLYTPALYEIAAIPQGEHALQYVKSSITIPLADIFYETSVQWLERAVIGIDRNARLLKFDNDETCPYDILVLALGAETNYFNVPGAEEFGFPLKTFADAVKLRDRIQSAIEDESPDLSIVIAGGGATGVEVAAEFENFVCALRDIRHPGKRCAISITLVEGGPEILNGFHPDVVKKARRHLERLGVSVKTGASVQRVEKDTVTLSDGSALTHSILVWAAGVKASKVLETLNLPLSKKGGLVVDQYLKAGEGIYALGDNAHFVHPETNQPLPWNASTAEDEAAAVTRNILADLSGKEPAPFHPKRQYPFILALGNKYAIADLVSFRLSGIAAWALKLVVELKYLLFILPFWSAISTWWKYVRVARSNDRAIKTAVRGA